MNTPTHILMGAAIFAQPGARSKNIAAVAGGVVPDLSIYIMWLTAKFIQGIPERVIWSQLHFSLFWQSLNALSNSIPLYLLILGLGVWRKWTVGIVFSGSALAHMGSDFLLHHDDAHRHFWPLTDWRFRSPVSYWDPHYHGNTMSIVEVCFAVVLIVALWRRFDAFWLRGLLAAALLSFAAVPLYFTYLI